MTFRRPLAIHNILIPPSDYTVVGRMAACYNQIWGPGGNSTLWEASLETEIDTASPGPGSYSFLLKRVGQPNAPQFNIRNIGTPAAPSANDAYVAINPDGDAAVGGPVTNSVTVQNAGAGTPPNQNGALGQEGFIMLGGYSVLLVFEFDDAILMIGRGSDRTYDCSHFGDIIEPFWTSDIDGGGTATRIGLGSIAGYMNITQLANYMFGSSNDARTCVRHGTGSNVQTWTSSVLATFTQASWGKLTFEAVQQFGSQSAGFNNFGPDGLTRISPFHAKPYRIGFPYGEWKYLYSFPDVAAFTPFRYGGTDYVMGCSHTTGLTGNMVIPVTEQYDPLVLGVFT